MYRIKIIFPTQLSKQFFFPEDTFNSYFGCASESDFNKNSIQGKCGYLCRILSRDKIFAIGTDLTVDKLYIAEYIIANYGIKHTAMQMIYEDIIKDPAYEHYHDVIDLSSIDNIELAVELKKEYLNDLLLSIDKHMVKHRMRNNIDNIMSSIRQQNASHYDQ